MALVNKANTLSVTDTIAFVTVPPCRNWHFHNSGATECIVYPNDTASASTDNAVYIPANCVWYEDKMLNPLTSFGYKTASGSTSLRYKVIE